MLAARPPEPDWQPDAALLDGLSLAAVAVDDAGVVVYANAPARELFGSPLSSLVGTDARERLFDDPELGVLDELLDLLGEDDTWSGDLPLRLGDRRTANVATTWTVVRRDDQRVGALVLVEPPADPDASEPLTRPLGRRLRRLARVTSELLAAEDVAAVGRSVTEHVMDAAGATVAALSLLEHDVLTPVAVRGDSRHAGACTRLALNADTPATECARTGRTQWVRGDDPAHPRALLCLPLVGGAGRVVGVVSLSFPGRRQLTEAEHVFLRLLADVCALSIERIEAQRAAADREAKLSFLAEVSGRLMSDLDYESTLAGVAEAGVPWFADWCTVSLLEDGRLRTIATAHALAEQDDDVDRLREEFGVLPGDGAHLVLESGRSLLSPYVTDERLAAYARDADHLALLRRLGMRSVLVCPLELGGRVLGTIAWVAGEHGRRYTQADRLFGEDLARRAALAIDNAQLHTQVRAAALELQRAVLPDVLYRVPGWTPVVEYLPAGRTETGGDFYDVVYLDDGRVACFVGDVMGRGVAAASTMAQMRSALRTLVAVDPEPTAVMAGLDKVVDTLHLEQLVTVVYAVADPHLDTLQVINAGHPPPVLLAADGRVEVLDPESTLLLGVGGGERQVRSVDHRPGDRLLLYTDGLVERRDEDADDGLDRLLAAARGTTPAGEEQRWLADLVQAVRDPTRDDDVAALLLVRDPQPG